MRARLRSRAERRLPHAALLVLAAVLAGAVAFLTWPARAVIYCERLPQLAALAACAAALLVLSFRGLAAAYRALPAGAGSKAGLGEDRRVPAGAAILAALAFFLSVHFIAESRKPCAAVQQQFTPVPPFKH